MGEVVSSVFGVAGDIFSSLFGGGAADVQEEVLPPSAGETQAQKDQKELLEAKKTAAERDREARQKVITARSAGAQTLFKREEAIPKATKLGGGRKA